MKTTNRLCSRQNCLFLLLALQLAGSERATGASPVVIQHPLATKVRAGGTLNLNVDATGTEPLTYTWYRGRTELGSGPAKSLTLSPVSAAHAGWYWVKVSNADGATGSDSVLVRVGTYAEWTGGAGANGHGYEMVQIGDLENDWAQMFRDAFASGGYLVSYHSLAEENFVNAIVPPAQATRLIGLFQPPGSFEPAGGWRWMSGEPFTYSRWNLNEPNNGGNGLNPRGQENLVGILDTGLWIDIHGGSRGYVLEYPTQLSLYNDLTNTIVGGYEAVAARAGAASKSAITYTWYLNGTLVPDVTGNALPLSKVLPAGGLARVEIGDGNSLVVSSTVEILLTPVFVESPRTTVVYQGDPATFSVAVAGPGPFTYQWYRNGTPVSGGNAATLTVTSATTGIQGSYHVEVGNANGSARSIPAELVVMKPNSRLVRLEEFEAGPLSGWSTPVTARTPSGDRRFLGEFGQEAVALNLSNLPVHDQITVSFDLILRGFWRGNAASEAWSMRVDNFTALQTTFSTYTTQSYPGNYFQASYPAATGSLERNTLGYELVLSQVSMLEDVRYRVTVTRPHAAAQAVLQFTSAISNTYETGWGIDNLVVTTSAANGSRLVIGQGGGPASLNLKVQSLPGASVTIRRSSDFAVWEFVQSVFNPTGELVIPVAPAQFGSPTFFRAEGN